MPGRWIRYPQPGAFSPKIYCCHNRYLSVLSANRSPLVSRCFVGTGPMRHKLCIGFTHNLAEKSGATPGVRRVGKETCATRFRSALRGPALLSTRDPVGRPKGFLPKVVSLGTKALLPESIWEADGKALRFFHHFHRAMRQTAPLCQVRRTGSRTTERSPGCHPQHASQHATVSLGQKPTVYAAVRAKQQRLALWKSNAIKQSRTTGTENRNDASS
jgi:hypothetical protein